MLQPKPADGDFGLCTYTFIDCPQHTDFLIYVEQRLKKLFDITLELFRAGHLIMCVIPKKPKHCSACKYIYSSTASMSTVIAPMCKYLGPWTPRKKRRRKSGKFDVTP